MNVPTDAGLHQVEWDTVLRAEAVQAPMGGGLFGVRGQGAGGGGGGGRCQGRAGGRQVPAGAYRVVLVIDGQEQASQSFAIEGDPTPGGACRPRTRTRRKKREWIVEPGAAEPRKRPDDNTPASSGRLRGSARHLHPNQPKRTTTPTSPPRLPPPRPAARDQLEGHRPARRRRRRRPGAVDAGIATLKAGGNATDAAVATILALSVTDAPPSASAARCRSSSTTPSATWSRCSPAWGRRRGWRPASTSPGRGGIPGQGHRGGRRPGRARRLPDGPRPLRHPTRSPRSPGRRCALLDRRRAGLARRPRPDPPPADRRPRSEARRRPPPRAPAGRRLLLPRPDRPRDRRLVARQRRPDPLRRPGHARHPRRGAGRRSSYRGHTVYKCGAWTQGPCLLEALQTPRGLRPRSDGARTAPDTIHLTVEAIKLAFADRDVYYADPLFARRAAGGAARPRVRPRRAGP